VIKTEQRKALDALLDARIAQRKETGAQVLSATEAIRLATADLEALRLQLERNPMVTKPPSA